MMFKDGDEEQDNVDSYAHLWDAADAELDAYLHPDRFSHSSMHSLDDFWSVSKPPPPKTLNKN